MIPTGYTLGNPESYERALNENPVVEKAIGGAWFPTLDAANAAIEDGCLPRAWFGELRIPARAYALYGGSHDDDPDEVGAFRLITPAIVKRVILEPSI